jgi:hypothetical protein
VLQPETRVTQYWIIFRVYVGHFDDSAIKTACELAVWKFVSGKLLFSKPLSGAYSLRT